MHQTCQPNSEDVKNDKRQRDIGDGTMYLTEQAFLALVLVPRFSAPTILIRACLSDDGAANIRQRSLALITVCDQPRAYCSGETDQERNDHRPAGRAMAYISCRLSLDEINPIP